MTDTGNVDGRVILISGATSESGTAVASTLARQGAEVVAVGTRQDALDELVHHVPAVQVRVCDLADAAAVADLHTEILGSIGTIDGLIHLVGGWRGGGGLIGQSDEDWAILDRAFATLRIVSREFYPDLLHSDAGRLAIVSSTSVDNPAPGGANYAAAKAAGEAWVQAIAQGFRKAAPQSAATIFVVKTLAGLEPALAERVAALWSEDATAVNGARIPLA